MKLYSVFSKTIETPEREALRAAFPHAAEYGEHYLFPMSYEQLTGETHENTVDMTGYNLTDTPENENDITFAQFNAQCDAMLSDETGREVLLSVQMGRYLKQSRYQPVEEETV